MWQAAQQLAQTFGWYGSVAVWRAGAEVGTVTMARLVPSSDTAWRMLQDIGGERASVEGTTAAGADVQNGDEIRATEATYIVEGCRKTPQLVKIALSEVAS